MSTPDISYFALFLCSLLLLLPFIISIIVKLRIIKTTLISVLRMTLQLVLIGLFLKYLFYINSAFINILWLIVMIIVATFNISQKIRLKFKVFFLPTCLSFLIATFSIILYLMVFVLNLDNIFDARFFVVIGGMLLGNSLRGNIIGISNFYKNIQRNEQRYLYSLAHGASIIEATRPYLQSSLLTALQPTIATMATMGIVFLPGMMTGQILSGLSPLLAIKYQLVIMIAIFSSTTIAVYLTIIFTTKTCFDNYGVLKKRFFK